MTEFMNLPSSVSGRRSSSGKLFQIRQRGNSGRQNGYGSSGRCMCQRRLNADGGDTCQRKPRCNRQQGKMVPSRATTYKLARLAYSPHDAEPAANGGHSKPEQCDPVDMTTAYLPGTVLRAISSVVIETFSDARAQFTTPKPHHISLMDSQIMN